MFNISIENIKKWFRINPDEENFNINRAMNRIHRYINKSNKELTKRLVEEKTKESFINDVKIGLVEIALEFEKNTKIIHKFLRRFFKHAKYYIWQKEKS